MTAASTLEARLDAGEFVVTAEVGPPRGADPGVIRRKAALLRGAIHAANVTDNQTAVVRMSSVAASRLLLDEGLEPILQMTCRDRNRIALQSDLLGAHALGIRNVIALSGDHQSFGDHGGAANVFDLDSVQLVQAIRRLSDEGRLVGGAAIEGECRFFPGAVENPFADPRAIRVPRLAKKVAAGARFIQTQCIFNLDAFEAFMDRVRARGLHERVHVLAGVTPLRSLKMAQIMATRVPGIDLPDTVLARMAAVPKDVKGGQKAEGLRIAGETLLRLRNVPGVHGVHLMAIEWEEIVPELLRSAGLLPTAA
jgi:methylenetetrahydrofolate reductase (NADPH)